MNTFASVVMFKQFSQVAFFAILREDESLSEAQKFFEKAKGWKELQKEVDDLVVWIREIGNRGANSEYFNRDENRSFALPPKGKRNRPERIQNNNIRLYCHWVSPHIVILFNGDIKTTSRAQDCPNVSSHFNNANAWAKKLDNIGIEHSGQEITNIKDLIFPV